MQKISKLILAIQIVHLFSNNRVVNEWFLVQFCPRDRLKLSTHKNNLWVAMCAGKMAEKDYS